MGCYIGNSSNGYIQLMIPAMRKVARVDVVASGKCKENRKKIR